MTSYMKNSNKYELRKTETISKCLSSWNEIYFEGYLSQYHR